MTEAPPTLEVLVNKLSTIVSRRGELTDIREEISQIFLEFRNMRPATEQSLAENRQYQEKLREEWNSALDNMRYNEESVPDNFQERRASVLSKARDEGRRTQYELAAVNAEIATVQEKLNALDAKVDALDVLIQELCSDIETLRSSAS